jgi:hypothetical protein
MVPNFVIADATPTTKDESPKDSEEVQNKFEAE